MSDFRISQFPDLPWELPWEDFLNQGPLTPGISTEAYATVYYIVLILGIVALIFIVIYALIGEEEELEET